MSINWSTGQSENLHQPQEASTFPWAAATREQEQVRYSCLSSPQQLFKSFIVGDWKLKHARHNMLFSDDSEICDTPISQCHTFNWQAGGNINMQRKTRASRYVVISDTSQTGLGPSLFKQVPSLFLKLKPIIKLKWARPPTRWAASRAEHDEARPALQSLWAD